MNDEISREEAEFYYIANIAAQNRNGRKVVLWGNSDGLRNVLKKYFHIDVAFVVTILDHLVNGTSIRHLHSMKGKSDQYYLISWGRACEEYYDHLLREYGYTEFTDYVYRMIRPVVIEDLNLSEGNYEDQYGNRISGKEGVIKRITFRGYNNRIKIDAGAGDLQKLEFDMCANGLVEIGEGTRFLNTVKFRMNGYNGFSSITIGRWCRFDETFFITYNHWHNSFVVINDHSSFEKNVAIHANSGKGVIIGRDCMFSRDIHLQSGDGHSLFDVHTKKNINTAYREGEKGKNYLLVGEHSWVCAGAFLLNGTSIGNGSVVAANSTVKGSFPNNCVIAGNPGKLVKKDVAWSREGCSENFDGDVRKEYAVATNGAKESLYGCNVLVIGGTRFMGLQLVKELLARGNRVTIATRGNTKDPFGDRIKRIKMDLEHPQTVKDALSGKHFDVVFHNLAYCSNYVKAVLDHVHCDRYIQLSSIAVYVPIKENTGEDAFDASALPLKWNFVNANYARGKREAEAAVVQAYPDISHVIVRVPYVSKTERLYYYCSHIVNGIPMKMENADRGFTFVRDTEVGRFLPWIAAQAYTGTINLSSTGMITFGEMIRYIERKTGIRAIQDLNAGDPAPEGFCNPSFSIDMSRAESLGYTSSSLNGWFWQMMDEYIARALREKKSRQIPDQILSVEKRKRSVGQYIRAHLPELRRKNEADTNKMTIEGVNSDLCTGCGACKNICPKDAIELQPDREGFLMPVINQEKCVSCGLCGRVCPTMAKGTYVKQNVSCYALMAQDELREVSSSGGAFSLLAERVLEMGGAVCGAAWTEQYRVKHTVIRSREQIPGLRGSKYVQSDTGDTFSEVRDILRKGRKVLYVGTPCQIDGLLHYLQKDYANLITVDLLCRGNASNELFGRFLQENYKEQVVQTIHFKDKKPLGWGATTSFQFDDGHVEKMNVHNSIWMCAYLADFMDRRSCYHCKFNSPGRVGDISIGDFWGIEKYSQDLNDRKGTSIVITSTEKGDRLVKSIGAKCKTLEEVPIERGIPYNSALCGHVKVTPRREAFFEALEKMPFSAAVDRTVYGEKYDIGIVGWWYNLNYGGTLTYYALHQALRKLGYSVLMIRRSSSGPAMPNDNTVPMRFAKKHYKISRLYMGRDMHWLNYSCRAFISGSDQLWNPYLEPYSGPEYFLSFVNGHNRKLSYASSFGGIQEVPGNYAEKYKPYLERFDGITVREDYAVDLCREGFGLSAVQVCDPIFLCDREQYEALADRSDLRLPDRYLLNFILDPTEEKVNAYRHVKNALELPDVVNFTDLQDVAERVKKFGEDGAFGNAEIEDFIKAYAQADFVITDSFHGTCLAIIFGKPFLSIANKKRGVQRFASLMNWIGLSDRLVDDVDEIYHRRDLLEPVDFRTVKNTIETSRNAGYEWLQNMLKQMS